ncbi:MAG: FadR/GntR family transcriptional regulator [Chloroflexota bacterium]|nr:MAG: hypothetical protein DLM70_03430 [Chloroflexota bacterium]
MFRPLESVRLSDGAVEQILQAIAEGDLKVGDSIPSERELMRQLNVGRASVREALRKLETMGVVDVRPGQGSVVVNTLTEAPASQLWKSWVSDHREEIFQLLDVREALETKAAALAVQHASSEDIEALRLAIGQQRATLPDGDPVVRAEADVAFHTALVRASGNRFLLALAGSLMYALHESRVGTYADTDRARVCLGEHIAIVDAVAARDVDEAKRATAAHLGSSKEFLDRERSDGHKLPHS